MLPYISPQSLRILKICFNKQISIFARSWKSHLLLTDIVVIYVINIAYKFPYMEARYVYLLSSNLRFLKLPFCYFRLIIRLLTIIVYQIYNYSGQVFLPISYVSLLDYSVSSDCIFTLINRGIGESTILL